MKKTLRLLAFAILSFFSLSASAAAYKTLTFPSGNSEEISGYDKTWTATIDEFTWTLVNFNNNRNGWAYVKCGNKSGSEGTITSDAIDKKISSVVVTVDKIISGYPESLKLEVSSDVNFSTISETIDLGAVTAGEKTFTIASPVANAYYRLTFISKSGASSNGVYQVSKVEYYQEGTGPVEEDYPEVANIAALKELESGSKAILTFNNVQVNFANGKDMYVQDVTGALDIYDCGLAYTAGQKLNGKATVEYKVYNGMPEITSITDAELTATDGTATPTEPALDAIDNSLLCHLVKATGTVYIESNEETGKTNYFLEDEDNNSVLFYRKWNSLEGTDLSGLKDGDVATVTGIVVLSNNTPAIGVTEIEYEGGGGGDETVIENIAALKELESGTVTKLKLTNAIVTFVNGKDMFVSDATGSIDFYNCSLTYTAGQVLNGTATVKYAPYKNTPEITSVTDNEFVATDGEATPKEVAVADVNIEKVCDYVKVSGTVSIEETTSGDKTYTDYYLVDESNNKVMIYRKWTSLDGTDLTTLNNGDTATVTGIVLPFNDTVEIGIITLESTSSGIENISADTTNDGPIYNVAGQRVEKAVKGIYIQNGKKFIVK